MPAQENTEAYPAEPHRQAGNNHGKFHIACGTKTIGRNEGSRPYKRLYDGNPALHIQAETGTFRLHTSEDRDRLCQKENGSATDDQDHFCDD